MTISLNPPPPPLLPPTSYLPPIKSLSSQPPSTLLAALTYLHQIYIPEVRGSRRIKPKAPPNTTTSASESLASTLALLRTDTYERAHVLRWLTALISHLSSFPSPSDSDSTETETDLLLDTAAALLAACAGTAAAGTLTRTFTFGSGPDAVHVQLTDAPLSNGDFGSVGAQTWGGACVLAELLVDAPARFGLGGCGLGLGERGDGDGGGGRLRVLELGAGTGLVSLALGKLLQTRSALLSAHAGADIFATDVHPAVLANLQRNIAANFPSPSPSSPSPSSPPLTVTPASPPTPTPPSPPTPTPPSPHTSTPPPSITVTAHRLDWSAPPRCAPFPLILGADIVYEAEHARWIHAAASALLARAPGARFHLVVPLRATHVREVALLEGLFPLREALVASSREALVPSSREALVSSREELDGTEEARELPVLCTSSKEVIVCDAEGDGAKAQKVEYAYYVIEWWFGDDADGHRT
ncbi:hypothetical protein DENSPDRAFT_182576 [Dentipellis sp. KUC8613]|nr:hypothetical protein DENSPDRAFT_182576 [Dentipellis sp. KUC8613]